jgi:hypothetical protein
MISRQAAARTEPPGMTALRLSQPPRTPPQWVSIRVLNGMLILFDVTGRVHMAGDRRTPWCRRCSDGQSLQTSPRRGAGWSARRRWILRCSQSSGAIKAGVRREWRLQARLTLLAFQAFQQRGFLAADVGAGAVMDVEIEIPAMDIVLADQLGVIRLLDGGLQRARARGWYSPRI